MQPFETEMNGQRQEDEDWWEEPLPPVESLVQIGPTCRAHAQRRTGGKKDSG